MTTSPISGSPTVPVSAADVAASKLTENFETFLTLLTTQLQNQDPLSPMESQEFVNQLVQFTEAEQAIATNKKLEQLLALQTTSQTTAGLGYIGKTVEVEGSAAPLQNGKAEWTYTLTATGPTSIVVADAEGIAVKTATGATTPGTHGFAWDGIMGNGEAAPPGVYKIFVRDAEGNTLELATTAVGTVTGLESGDDGLMLVLDDLKVPVGEVHAVLPPAPQAS